MVVVGGRNGAFHALESAKNRPGEKKEKKSKQSMTRSDLYLQSFFTRTLGVPHNAVYIGFVYTSLGLKGHRDGWWEREGQRWLHLESGSTEGELCPSLEHKRRVSGL